MSKVLTVYLAADVDKFRREMRGAENQIDNFGGKAGGLGGMVGGLGTMLAGAALAAGAFAVKLGVDAVQSAMDEEAAIGKLNTTLANLGFASASDQVGAFIDDLQYSSNVSDDQLRPSFERLLIATGSVTSAQKALRLALDVSAGSGKSLDAVSNALGKAYEGNTGALGKLGTGLDKATLKSGDMDAITKELAGTFDGQASTAANSLKGQFQGVQIAVDELSEAFGTGLIDGLTTSSGGVEDFEQTIKDMGEAAGMVGKFLGGAVVAAFYYLSAQVRQMGTAVSYLDKAWIQVSYSLGRITEGEYRARMAAADANIAFNEQTAQANYLSAAQAAMSIFTSDASAAFEYQQYAAYGDAAKIKDLGDETDDTTDNQTALGAAIHTTNSKLDAQRNKTQDFVDDLKDATTKVAEWTTKIVDYRTALTQSVTGDLGTVLSDAFGQQGQEGGKTLLEAFRGTLSNSENFVGLLEQMKAGGASQTLIDAVAQMGPDMGSKLAKQMLEEGLVKTISDEWEGTRGRIYEITSTLVPDFMKIGQEGAIGMLKEAEAEVTKSEKKLRKIGADIGEPIGSVIKEKIAAATQEAINAALAAAAAIRVTVPVTPGTPTPTGSASPTATTTRANVINLDNLITTTNARGGTADTTAILFT